MDYSTYITAEMLIVIPCLYIIGEILKLSKIDNRYIPFILLILGITLSVSKNGVNTDAIIQGILIAGTSVFTNEVIHQAKKK